MNKPELKPCKGDYKMERLTEHHAGVAVIKDKSLLPQAMKKLAKIEDEEEKNEVPDWKRNFMKRFERRQ